MLGKNISTTLSFQVGWTSLGSAFGTVLIGRHRLVVTVVVLLSAFDLELGGLRAPCELRRFTLRTASSIRMDGGE